MSGLDRPTWEARALEHEHEHSRTRTSTSTSTRVRHDHKHESTRAPTNTRARARARALEHMHQMHSSASTRWSGNQCEPPGERHAKPVRYFFNQVGLHVPGWLYVLGIPPHGYLPDFGSLNPHSTCDLGRGQHLSRGVRASSLRTPGPRTRETTPRPKEKRTSSSFLFFKPHPWHRSLGTENKYSLD